MLPLTSMARITPTSTMDSIDGVNRDSSITTPFSVRIRLPGRTVEVAQLGNQSHPAVVGVAGGVDLDDHDLGLARLRPDRGDRGHEAGEDQQQPDGTASHQRRMKSSLLCRANGSGWKMSAGSLTPRSFSWLLNVGRMPHALR